MGTILSGNEAIAIGAWEAGVTVGVGYPGTPSTETLETFAKLNDVYAEWCPNEKVALEVAFGVSAAGRRSLVTMKHVGVNVAADPLLSGAMAGVNGGLVLLAADDPGMHSSQNEQDSRNYAAFARIPCLDPSDSQEAHDMTKCAYELSEEFDTPIIIRSTVRISHTKTVCETGERVVPERLLYAKNPGKWVLMPANAIKRRKAADDRTEALKEFADGRAFEHGINRIELRDKSVGIICTGAVYQHVREALPDASVLKLGLSWPVPEMAIAEFANTVDSLYVVEEASDYLTMQVKVLGITLDEPENELPAGGELSARIIREAFGLELAEVQAAPSNLPPRPPALCAGCPHRLVYSEIARCKTVVTGDIGCYTLGSLPPLSAVDTCVDMGASISMAHGMELAGGFDKPVISVIGDSTFAHSGITSLLNIAYNKGKGVVCILDNRTTAMTGQQGNPCNGITLQNRPSRELDIVELVKALGIEDVQLVDSQNLKAIREALAAAMAAKDELSVIVFKSPCVMLVREKKPPFAVDHDACRSCKRCLKIGCPAIEPAQDGKAFINPAQCIGCGQCAQVCTFDCISSQEGR